MISNTLSQLPGGIEYDTVYPANLLQDIQPAIADVSSPTSSILLRLFMALLQITSYINNGLVNCPLQKYALLGYSQGI